MNVKKKTMGILFLLLLSVTSTYAQQRINVNYKEQPLTSVITDLKTKTGYDFVYQKKTLVGARPVTLAMNNVTLQEVLDRIFYRTNLEYEIVKKGIIIRPRQKAVQPFRRTIRGVVYDDEGSTLPGASVLIQGTNEGTICDAQGNFSIQVDSRNPILVFSYVGMKDKELLVTTKTGTSVSVTLESNINQLNDVIVTGYQQIKRENATGSYQKISAKDMDQRYTGDITSNLEGKVPGLVKYNNGVTNGITIRGAGSLSASTNPLVVVNGLPISGSIETINPYEIESITVLKDASAAAIYGARASNGVIVVVTKKAQSEKLSVDFNADLRIANKPNYDNMNWCNAAEEMELNEYNFDYIKNHAGALQALKNQYSQYGRDYSPFFQLMMNHYLGSVSDAEYKATKEKWSKNDFRKEWRDLLLRNDVTQQYNLALRTKGKYLNSSISLNYKTDNNASPGEYTRTLRLNYEGLLNVAKWMDMSFGLYVESGRTKSRLDKFGYRQMGSFHSYQSIWNDDGTPATLRAEVALDEPNLLDSSYGFKSEEFVLQNDINHNFKQYRSTLIRPHIQLNVRPIPELNLSAQFQYEDSYDKAESYYEAESYDIRHLYNLYTYNKKHYMPDGGLLDTDTSTGANYTFRTQANFDKTFAEKHAVEAIVGFEYRETKSRGNSSEIIGYNDQTQTNSTAITNLYDAYNLRNCDIGSQYSPVGHRLGTNFYTNDILHRFYSIYFTGDYTYDHRYSASFSYRKDKTDLFGADPKFRGRPLWSVGASWNMQNEAFMRSITWIDVLKLRGSYGLTGNIDSSVSSYLTAKVTTEKIAGTQKATLNTPPNDQLRWEKTASWNFGADFSLFNNRLNGSLDVYYKKGTDILSTTDLDPTSGWSSLRINNAKIRNQGVELQLNGTILPAKNRNQLEIDASFGLALNNNKVLNINHEITSGSEALQRSTYHKGKPIHSLYSLAFGGLTIDKNGNQQANFKKKDGTLSDVPSFEDGFKPEDAVFSGGLDPKLTANFTPEISYKGFTLSAMFVFFGGHYMRVHADEWTVNSGMEYSLYDYTDNNLTTNYLLPKSMLNYWRSEDKTKYLANGYAAQNMNIGSDDPTKFDFNVVHADYLKLRTLVLGYRFSPLFCHKIGVNSLRLRIQMNNVFTSVRNSDGIDPEAVNPFTGYATVKTPKSYTMSLSVNF
jgi:TonB-linked SusC/RagA family outer membrane protein